MRAVDILHKKRDGLMLSSAEIEAFVRGVVTRTWPDYQTAALLMAIVLCGMNAEETASLTRAMVSSGQRLDLSSIPGPKVDKHSSGGVGDNASLSAVPLAAACGVIVPKMSGRALGHTGGTLDKLEAIPGFRVNLELDELRAVLREVGCAIIGQSQEIAPADKMLYALRDVTATVESIPLITASIMSKKIAEGIDALVLDVKCGQGAFMKSRFDAEALASALVQTGREHGVRTQAVLTDMDAPLGRAVGNALEVRECIQTLRGEGPPDLETLSLLLAARMVSLGKEVALPEAENQVREALARGHGLEKFRHMVERQGGDGRVVDEPGRLPSAPRSMLIHADRTGFVIDVQAEQVGRACVLLGAGRQRAGDPIDPAVGVMVTARRGERVQAGGALAEIHYRDTEHLEEALAGLRDAWKIGDEEPVQKPLVLDCVGG
jgi:pyrimidine-nucleoside phosphorylase